ncbi:DUF1835 domain-containing protein [Coprobacillus sp. AM18-4LB-d2]|nr:DUF1835 domain-containing protein [Thomasclavelia cocleata]MCI9630611.1 DUF1835 domain-containing protein [Thomasclavelia cocleata]RHH09287.1 DUF1835 domain-containing protein [Coprobacillus sp. AM18-4LB-d2]
MDKMIEVCFDSTTEANLRYLYATGFIDSDTILCCPDDYSLGNFKNFSINERYEQLCKYGVVDYGKRNKEYFYNKYSLFLNGLYKIKQGDKIRVWMSHVPMEMVGFFVVCYFLRDVLNRIYVCDANIVLQDISKHSALLNCPSDFMQLMNKMRSVSILRYSEIGEKIFLTNKPIKLIKNGEVIMMNEEDFDNFIYNVINSQKENNTERIVEEVLKKSLINFLYLYKKIKKMVEESK